MIKFNFVLLSLLAFSCTNQEDAPTKPIVKQMITEEYMVRDYSDPSIELFEKFLKREFIYDQNKLTQINQQEYNLTLSSYEASYRSDEFQYDSQGKLIQWNQFLANGGKWIKEYDYSVKGETKVSRYEQLSGGNRVLMDWSIVRQTSSMVNIKYYQGANQLYAEVNCDRDAQGNIIGLSRTPSLPVGKVYYTYDDAPNPYYFPELGSETFSMNRYLPKNNFVETTNDASTRATLLITYDFEKYPTEIRGDSYKRVITYNK